MPKHDIVVVGGSAGSLEALSKIVAGLPHNLPASVFVVIHSSPGRESDLANILSRAGNLEALLAIDKQVIETGKIYIAPPDCHLLVENRHLSLVHGPRENRSRPAIDEVMPEEKPASANDDLRTEVKISQQQMDSKGMIDSVKQLGRLSMFTCPECHGTLWEVKDGELLRYRCHVGHAFSIDSLEAEQAEKLEGALWSALRALEERVGLARRLAGIARERNSTTVAKNFEARANEANEHAQTIRTMLLADPERSMIHGD